tara:strand:- start:169 stop:672 length:504 start_codon:yes stop_codon:yes gene_type:complete
MIRKNSKLKKNERSLRNFLKIKNSIDQKNLNFRIDSEEKLDLLIKSINKFMIERLEAVQSDDCLTYFLQNMKRYKIMTSIMEAYSTNSGTTYKEEIIKKLRIYSYKTISSIIDDSIERGYIKYVNYPSNNSQRKIKKFRPTSTLITNYINWTLQHVGNLNQTLKHIK